MKAHVRNRPVFGVASRSDGPLAAVGNIDVPSRNITSRPDMIRGLLELEGI